MVESVESLETLPVVRNDRSKPGRVRLQGNGRLRNAFQCRRIRGRKWIRDREPGSRGDLGRIGRRIVRVLGWGVLRRELLDGEAAGSVQGYLVVERLRSSRDCREDCKTARVGCRSLPAGPRTSDCRGYCSIARPNRGTSLQSSESPMRRLKSPPCPAYILIPGERKA